MAALPYGSLDYDPVREVSWDDIQNKPTYALDWTVDQGDINIDANNLPLLNYAPNTLASNGTAGLTNFNFTQARKDKLAGIADGAEVNVQADWTAASGDAQILHKPDLSNYLTAVPTSVTQAIASNTDKRSCPTWVPSSDPSYLTAVPTSVTQAIAANTNKNSCPTWVPSSDPSYLTAVPTSVTDAIAQNTFKLGVPSGSLSTFGKFLKSTVQQVGESTPTYPAVWSSITKATVGLDNVTNESKAVMFHDPIFTGTVSGITQSMISGLVSALVGKQATLTSADSFSLDALQLNSIQLAGSDLATTITQIQTAVTYNTAQVTSKAPKASPAFTGTVSGISQSMVGLGNVTNESKAQMFSSPTFTGTTSGSKVNFQVAHTNKSSQIVTEYWDVTLLVKNTSTGADESRLSVHQNGGIYYVGAFVNVSDDRIKSYEEPLTNATTELNKLNPKRYKKHPSLVLDEDNEAPDLTGVAWSWEYGLIAQELETDPVLSHFVKVYPETGMRHVNYMELIPVLVQGFKELSSEVESLKARLTSLGV